MALRFFYPRCQREPSAPESRSTAGTDNRLPIQVGEVPSVAINSSEQTARCWRAVIVVQLLALLLIAYIVGCRMMVSWWLAPAKLAPVKVGPRSPLGWQNYAIPNTSVTVALPAAPSVEPPIKINGAIVNGYSLYDSDREIRFEMATIQMPRVQVAKDQKWLQAQIDEMMPLKKNEREESRERSWISDDSNGSTIYLFRVIADYSYFLDTRMTMTGSKSNEAINNTVRLDCCSWRRNPQDNCGGRDAAGEEYQELQRLSARKGKGSCQSGMADVDPAGWGRPRQRRRALVARFTEKAV